MPPKELPPQVAELMLRGGAVVLFGPDYLEDSTLLLKELKGTLAGKAVLSSERIDDLRVPDGPALNALMVFFHRMPKPFTTFKSWETALLQGVELTSRPPKGLGQEDASPEKPKVEFVPMAGQDAQLIVTWTRPLEASHLAWTARAIESSYLKNGGEYDAPGILERLRRLLS